MSRKSTSSFLEEAVGLLVQYFGVDRVRAALAKVRNGTVEGSDGQPRRPSSKPHHQANPSVPATLEELRQKDEEKHRLLTDFYTQLKDRRVLPEPQDIRHFAQIIGLKEIGGKSRKDMIPRLMRFLLEQPTQRLQVDVETAASVSEQQRQQGFSVLTDKLVGDKGGKKEPS
ncbi:MAG TPA: hypothetical protein VK395_33180 [Gemmataceae bacterium]|nr:hypothetical protein [Gemmataceae bacterium]